MKKIIFIVLLLVLSNYLYCQEKIFIREYRYSAGETDSKISAREKAIEQVKAILLEELGTYVESWVNYNVKESDKINESFFQQEIKIISAGTTETKILEESWNGYEFYIKAQIKADPNEVVRRINQTLSARRSSVVIDSLKLLLNASNQEIQLHSQKLKIVQTQLNSQNRNIIEKQNTLNALNQQLTNARKQLLTYQAQEKQILSKIEAIEQQIKNATTKAVKNVRIGMTPNEVRKVCGTPRSISYPCDEYNYGSVWVIFKSGVVKAVIDSRDFKSCRDNSGYDYYNAKFILR